MMQIRPFLCVGAVLIGCGSVALASEPSGMAWKEANGTKIPVPPREHPRLYLRAGQVAQLKARLDDPVLRPVVDKLQAMARKSAQFDVEWKALCCLAGRERTAGPATVEKTLKLLEETQLPDVHDACRVTGRMMVTGAIVYDWLYELLTAEQKKAFIREFVRLAKTQECGYPNLRGGSVTGHASEAMIMRDMLSAGIAIYDEFPEMYELAAGRFFREHLPARNWLYPGHAYHQGDSYGVVRYGWDTYPLWIFDRLGAGNVYNPEQRFVPYLWLYATRPDGQRLRAGDTFSHHMLRGQPWSEGSGTLLTASYYGDGYLLGQSLRQGLTRDKEALFELLWRDTNLQPKAREDLPLSRYFPSPFGWMIARTGWDDNAAIAEMKINVYNFTNHQHMDAGAFQLYYRGALAIDSGLYSGSAGQYGSSHCYNYYWRTIAHNSLLVLDPREVFAKKRDLANDGGQRLPNGRTEPKTLSVLLAPENGYCTGEVLAHGFGPDASAPAFTLLQGDITAAYSDKVRQVRRGFVFLNLGSQVTPAAMIVFDRVVAADSAFRKSWLLHSEEEPKLGAASATIDCTRHGDRGRLLLDVLLPMPENQELVKVGGPGKEFWVAGTNYANDVPAGTREHSSMELGEWRVELSPKQSAATDLFLNVMQLTDGLAPARLPVERIVGGTRVGCRLQGPDGFWQVLFHQAGGASEDRVSMASEGRGMGHYLITDLAPGLWSVRREGEPNVRNILVPDDSHVLWFEGQSGKWTMQRVGETPRG